MNIGNSLKMRRNELGLTQSEVAEKLYVTRQTISNWENNKSYPNIDCLIKLSNLYEMTLDRLLKEDNTMVEKLSKDIREGQKYKKLFLILLIIVLCIGGYFTILQLRLNNFYSGVKEWNQNGQTYNLIEDNIQYHVVKIDNYNLFTIPEELELMSSYISENEKFNMYYSGDDSNIKIYWTTGALNGLELSFDKEFIFDNVNQRNKFSYEIQELINKNLDKDKKELTILYKQTKNKWEEIN